METNIDQDIRLVLRTLWRTEHLIRNPNWETSTDGVWFADGVVPESLHAELKIELDKIAEWRLLRMKKDATTEQCAHRQHLIDPTLYTYSPSDRFARTDTDVGGRKPTDGAPDLPPAPFSTTFLRHFTSPEDELSSHDVRARYSMVPTVFRVSPQGDDVVIEGDLSGLLHASRCTDPEPSSGVGIERRLEQVFLLAMPLLWRSLQCVEGYDGTEFLGGPGIEGSDSGDRWFGREDLRAGHETTYQQWRDALDAQAQEKQVKTDEKKQKMRSEREMMEEEWKNRRQRMVPDEQWAYTPPFASEELKVILEAVNVIIPPKNTVEEMFHMEGLPHERIAASCVYVYDTIYQCDYEGPNARAVREGRDAEGFFLSNFEFRRLKDGDWDFPYSGAEQENFIIQSRQVPIDYDYPSDWEGDQEFITQSRRMENVRCDMDGAQTGFGTGRIVSYPNWTQIRYVGENLYNEVTVIQKLLYFHLVRDGDTPFDPERNLLFMRWQKGDNTADTVPTTKDIPALMLPASRALLHVLLPAICKARTRQRQNFPAELVELVIGHLRWMGWWGGLGRAEAETRRREYWGEKMKNMKRINEIWDGEREMRFDGKWCSDCYARKSY